MSDDLVKRADEVLKNVTPGPWVFGEYEEDSLEVFTFKNELPRPLVSIDLGYNGVVDDENYANLRFIAAARDLVPAMRNRIEADAKRIAELENRLGAIAASDMNDLVLMGMARDAAEARIAELERERDEARAELRLADAGMTAKNETSEARIAELEAALREIEVARDLENPCEYNRGWNASRSRLRAIARAALEGEKT